MTLRLDWKAAALACLSGGVLAASFPLWDIGLLAWFGLVPLLVAVEGKRPLAAGGLAFLSGLVFFPGIFHWALSISDYNLLDHALLAVYLSLYLALFGLAVAWIRRRTDLPFVLIAPPLWVLTEYLRAHASFLAFPWLLLGYSQYRYHALIQITSFTGVYGLSFLIVLANALGADAFRAWRRRVHDRDGSTPAPRRSLAISAAGVTAAVVGTVGYGGVVLSEPPSQRLMKVAVVQGNLPQQAARREAVLERYAALTREAAQQAPALIVWPETAVPGDVKHDSNLKRTLNSLAAETGAFLLVGSAQYAKFAREGPPDRALANKLHNTLFLVSPTGQITGEYRKIILVPFGEYEPLKGIITWPRAIAAGFGSMLPGDQYTVFSAAGHTFGAVICWEAMFPHLFREFVRRGATFMVSATNESWFGPTAAPYQLLAMSAIRAAENRVAIARAASTGLSAFIDPYGRITDRIRGERGELFVHGILVRDVPLSGAGTLYSRHGDVFAVAQLGLSAALLGYGALARKRMSVPQRSYQSA